MFKKIVIIERSKIIREGVISLLKTLKVCQTIKDMESPEEWPVSSDEKPDLIILGYEWAKDGIDKIRTKFHIGHNTLIVGLIYNYYILKDISDLFDEVLFITDDELIIENKFRRLSERFRESDSTGETERLTDREKDVLRLLVQGLSNKEVAERLIISPHTVITHRKNIIEKTGIRSLAGLAVYAILNNIADMDDLNK